MRTWKSALGVSATIFVGVFLGSVNLARADNGSQLREDIMLAKVRSQLSSLTPSRQIDFEARSLGLTGILLGARESFDQAKQQLDTALTGTDLSSNYTHALSLATNIGGLIHDNIVLQDTLARLTAATSECSLGTKIEAGIAGSQGLISNTDNSARNIVTAAGLLIPVVFYNCDFPQPKSTQSSPGTSTAYNETATSSPEDGAATSRTIPPAIDTSYVNSDGTVGTISPNGPLSIPQLNALDRLASSSINAIQGLKLSVGSHSDKDSLSKASTTGASASTALAALLTYVPTLTAMKSSAIDKSIAGEDSLTSCRLLTRLEQADNGFSGLVKGESDGKKNTVAIVGLALPIFFSTCKQ